MRLASYNIEWMNGLFEGGALALDGNWSGRYDITRREQGEAIAQVLSMVDADIWVIQEAPHEDKTHGTKHKLEAFARAFGLRVNRATIGFPSTTDQEIALLYDPKTISVRRAPQGSLKAPRFDKEFETTINGQTGHYVFSKPPLEARIKHLGTGFSLRMIGCHLKTKAPHGAKNDQEAVKIGFENRRKQLAQARWLRARIENIRAPLIVAGDFNDGPDFDEYEQIIGHSTIDVLTNKDALYSPALKNWETLSTARFYNRDDQSYKEALLDFIFVNPALRPYASAWRIWHPLNNPKLAANESARRALLAASDHFPVTVDLDLPTHYMQE